MTHLRSKIPLEALETRGKRAYRPPRKGGFRLRIRGACKRGDSVARVKENGSVKTMKSGTYASTVSQSARALGLSLASVIAVAATPAFAQDTASAPAAAETAAAAEAPAEEAVAEEAVAEAPAAESPAEEAKADS